MRATFDTLWAAYTSDRKPFIEANALPSMETLGHKPYKKRQSEETRKYPTKTYTHMARLNELLDGTGWVLLRNLKVKRFNRKRQDYYAIRHKSDPDVQKYLNMTIEEIRARRFSGRTHLFIPGQYEELPNKSAPRPAPTIPINKPEDGVSAPGNWDRSMANPIQPELPLTPPSNLADQLRQIIREEVQISNCEDVNAIIAAMRTKLNAPTKRWWQFWK